MKVIVEINNQKHEVEINQNGNEVTARIDDREYLLESSEPESNVFLLKNKGKIFEAFVTPESSQGSFHLRIGSTEFEANVIDPKRLRGAKGDDEHAAGRAEVRTAMPGKIVRILVTKGETVKKGDGIIVVEAMKMQNEMKSPKDGLVSEIKVAESDTVSAGDVLVIIE